MEIVKVMLFMLFVGHFIACAWHFIGQPGFADVLGEPHEDQWLVATGADSLSLGRSYVIAYHWAMSNFVGNSDIEAKTTVERLYAIAVLSFSFMVLAVVPPRITSLMTTYQSALDQNNIRFTELTTYLQINGISQQLAVQVQRAALSGLRLQRVRTPEANVQLLQHVPPELRAELRWEMYSSQLLTHPLFRRIDQVHFKLSREVCYKAVSPLQLADEDHLFTAWEYPECPAAFYFAGGNLSYTPISADKVTRVALGSWIAEAALWTRWLHRGDALATEDCHFLILNAGSFQDLVVASELHSEVRTYAEQFTARLNSMEPEALSDLDFTEEIVGELAKAFSCFVGQ